MIASAFERVGSTRGCVALLGFAVTVWVALAMWLTRGTTFFLDDVTFFLTSRGFEPRAVLTPANGHLLAVPRLIYATVFELFGADYVALRLVEVGGIALVGVLFFLLARRRVGDPAALLPTVVLLFLGSTTIIPLSSDGMPIVYSVALGLAALLMLERRNRRADLLACALLTLSVATYSLGLIFLVGVAISVLERGDRWRRSWVALVPATLYALWLLLEPRPLDPAFTGLTGLRLANVLLIPGFVADSASAVTAAVSGLSYDFSGAGLGLHLDTGWGRPLALALAALLGLRLRRGGIPWSLWVSLGTLFALWAAEGMVTGPLRPPDAGRYLYPAAVLGLLVAADATSGTRASRRALGILVALTAVALATNLAQLRNGARFLRSYAPAVRAQLTAIELARDHVAPGFVPAAGPLAAFGTQVRPRNLFPAIDRNGSFALSLEELRTEAEPARELADSTLAAALRLRLGPASGPRGKCVRVERRTGPTVEILARPPGVAIRAATGGSVTLRRFGGAPRVALGRLAARAFAEIRIPPDRAHEPWLLVVQSAAAPVTVCDAAPTLG
jgi:hypothetical protein